MSQLNLTIDKFYLSILKYAGIVYSDNIFKNVDSKLGDITIDGKHITMPYMDNLKDPDNKIIFHLLNENYTNPETTLFNLYKKRLVLELNLKLSYLIINLISVASDVQLQQKIKSGTLVDLISNIGEVDHILIENFIGLIKASKKISSEAFLFDIFLKKNGEVNGTPYAAIGKINFLLPNEVNRALSGDYKAYGYKLRKKDLLVLTNIFNTLFQDFSEKDKYIEGTDNKVFRYLNILLKSGFMVSDRINEVTKLLSELKEPTLKLDDSLSDHDWTLYLEELYGMTSAIRLIPNQTDMSVESHKLRVDESKAAIQDNISTETNTINPNQQVFNPNSIPTVQPPQTPTVYAQPQKPRQLTPEEIINGQGIQQPMGYQQPMGFNNMQMSTQPTYTPSWVMQENMRNNQLNNYSNMGFNVNMQPSSGQQQLPNGNIMLPDGNIVTPQQYNMMISGNNNMGFMNPQFSTQNTGFGCGSGLTLNPHMMNTGTNRIY